MRRRDSNEHARSQEDNLSCLVCVTLGPSRHSCEVSLKTNPSNWNTSQTLSEYVTIPGSRLHYSSYFQKIFL